MDVLVAILIYFGFMTPQQAGVTPMQVNQILQANQPTLQFYIDIGNPEEVRRIITIDRAEG